MTEFQWHQLQGVIVHCFAYLSEIIDINRDWESVIEWTRVLFGRSTRSCPHGCLVPTCHVRPSETHVYTDFSFTGLYNWKPFDSVGFYFNFSISLCRVWFACSRTAVTLWSRALQSSFVYKLTDVKELHLPVFSFIYNFDHFIGSDSRIFRS